MGDRGNIAVIQSEDCREQVWFYTHWRGSEIKEVVAEALVAAPGRWTDYPYLARVIFSHLVPAERRLDETGYGISTRIGDNEHAIVVVDCPRQRVFMVAEEELTAEGKVPGPKDGLEFGFFAKQHAPQTVLVKQGPITSATPAKEVRP